MFISKSVTLYPTFPFLEDEAWMFGFWLVPFASFIIYTVRADTFVTKKIKKK
jgi:hypothetical protein